MSPKVLPSQVDRSVRTMAGIRGACVDHEREGGVMGVALLERGTLTPVVETGDGDRIRDRRTELGLTIRALAERAGIDRGQLSDIERGMVAPRAATLGQIQRALTEFEDETSGPYDEAEKRTVTFRMSGNFGVDVTVSGPVENLAELEDSVGRLLQRMRAEDG